MVQTRTAPSRGQTTSWWQSIHRLVGASAFFSKPGRFRDGCLAVGRVAPPPAWAAFAGLARPRRRSSQSPPLTASAPPPPRPCPGVGEGVSDDPVDDPSLWKGRLPDSVEHHRAHRVAGPRVRHRRRQAFVADTFRTGAKTHADRRRSNLSHRSFVARSFCFVLKNAAGASAPLTRRACQCFASAGSAFRSWRRVRQRRRSRIPPNPQWRGTPARSASRRGRAQGRW